MGRRAREVIEWIDAQTDVVVRADRRVEADETPNPSCVLVEELTLPEALHLVAGVYRLVWTHEDGVVVFRPDPRFDPEGGEILDLRALEPFSDFGPGERHAGAAPDVLSPGLRTARWGPFASISGDPKEREAARERLGAIQSHVPETLRTDLRREGTEFRVVTSSGHGAAVRAGGSWTLVRAALGERGAYAEVEDPLASAAVRLEPGVWRELAGGLSIRVSRAAE